MFVGIGKGGLIMKVSRKNAGQIGAKRSVDLYQQFHNYPCAIVTTEIGQLIWGKNLGRKLVSQLVSQLVA